jgi:hypothetical protein
MIPMINIYWLRPKIGDAVWLWNLLNGFMKYIAEEQWLTVADGKPVSDLDIGTRLFCTEETVKAWREKLESVGLIRTELLPARDAIGQECRTFQVVNLGFGAPQDDKTSLGSTAIH